MQPTASWGVQASARHVCSRPFNKLVNNTSAHALVHHYLVSRAALIDILRLLDAAPFGCAREPTSARTTRQLVIDGRVRWRTRVCCMCLCSGARPYGSKWCVCCARHNGGRKVQVFGYIMWMILCVVYWLFDLASSSLAIVC